MVIAFGTSTETLNIAIHKKNFFQRFHELYNLFFTRIFINFTPRISAVYRNMQICFAINKTVKYVCCPFMI